MAQCPLKKNEGESCFGQTDTATGVTVHLCTPEENNETVLRGERVQLRHTEIRRK